MAADNNLLNRALISIVVLGFLASCAQNGASEGGGPRRQIAQSGDSNGANSSSNSRTYTPSPETQGPTSIPPSASQPSVTPPIQNAECHKGEPFLCKIEQLIADKTNKYRASKGLQPLKLDSKISFVARDWSQKQSQSFISHFGFPNARKRVYQAEFNEATDFFAENVAYTGGVQGSNGRDDAAAEAVAEEFATMWWKSWGHRRNMLGNHSAIGVGVFQKANGAWFGTQVFQ